MLTPDWRHGQGCALPNDTVEWRDGAGGLVDLSTATWSLVCYPSGSATPAFAAKTTGITGTASTSPNATISWASSGEVAGLASGLYRVVLTATIGGKARRFPRDILLEVEA